MTELTEKDQIIRDLYVMETFYKNKEKYDKLLSQEETKITRAEIKVLGSNHYVESEDDILKEFALHGNKFNDNYGKNKPIEVKKISLDSNANIDDSYFIVGMIVFGSIFLVFGIWCLIMLIYWLVVDPDYVRNENVLYIATFILLVLGIVPIVIGVKKIIAIRQATKKATESERLNKESLYQIKEWEKEQDEIIANRMSLVESLYKDEYETAKNMYNKLIAEYNQCKNEYLVKIHNIYSSIIELKKNSIIPIYYLENSEAVEKMLFFMLNKRADTIKELVNLYETTKWQENMLNELSSTNNALIQQNLVTIQGMLKIDSSINKVVYDMENMEIESYSIGYLI